MQGLNDTFKCYRVGIVANEIKRIESLLEDEKNWSTSFKDLKSYKALESQRNNLI